MNENTDTESFYDKYFVHIWYSAGYILTVAKILNPISIERAGYLLLFIVSLVAAIPAAFFLYTVFIFSYFIINLVFDGVKEKDIRLIFLALYFSLGLIPFIMDTFKNA